jgi:hypothetical protein
MVGSRGASGERGRAPRAGQCVEYAAPLLSVALLFMTIWPDFVS